MRSLKTRRIIKLKTINKPQAKPTVKTSTPAIEPAIPLTEFTQLTIKTGAVSNFEDTASVAPVSLTLRVKTIIAPERMEYFVIGSTIIFSDASNWFHKSP